MAVEFEGRVVLRGPGGSFEIIGSRETLTLDSPAGLPVAVRFRDASRMLRRVGRLARRIGGRIRFRVADRTVAEAGVGIRPDVLSRLLRLGPVRLSLRALLVVWMRRRGGGLAPSP